MINQVIFIFIFTFILDVISQSLTKKLILLPYNSPLCNNTFTGIHKFYEFTISQQVDFETEANVSSVLPSLQSVTTVEPRSYLTWPQIDSYEPIKYICRALVKPVGRALMKHTEKGTYSFWSIRARISRFLSSSDCSDSLLLQLRNKDNMNIKLESHSAKIVNITCKDSLPIVIPSSIRKLYITYFSSDLNSPGFLINITSFIYFQGEFATQFQQDLCRRQDGFWCGNETNACIYRDLRCDGYDSCYDGGSDEFDCQSMNKSNPHPPPFDRKPSIIDYLPWLALGILPLILLMALVCICNQHRSEVFFDDDEDNLDVEKSQDDDINGGGDHVWSSMDRIDHQLDKISDIVEEGRGNVVDADNDHSLSLVGTEPLIGLHAVPCAATVKADVASSPTESCHLHKDYEDIDKSAAETKLENGLMKSSVHCLDNNEMDGKEAFMESAALLASGTVPNAMTVSEITDEDYVLEDVGSLLRKVDKSKIPEETRINSIKSTLPGNENSNTSPPSDVLDYRSDYILV